jgi:DNA polymerase-1
MIAVDRALSEEGLRSRLLLQVHDELIVEAPEDEAEYVRTLVTGKMEGVIKLLAPLKADAGTGKSWYEAKN